jgi:Ca2+-binding EF-hand superfamily protein
MTSEEADKEAANAIAEMDETAKLESEASTVTDISTTEVVAYEEEEVEVEDEALNHAIARLQSKIGTMLDKIEIQISDVQLKIGDKFHLLDKDMDGVLSMEEMAECLQSVLKRELTSEEAMAIAADMDENEDGFFTVAELLKWVETNKLVRLVENGRDAEVDRIIARSAKNLHRHVDGEQRSATEETKDSK